MVYHSLREKSNLDRQQKTVEAYPDGTEFVILSYLHPLLLELLFFLGSQRRHPKNEGSAQLINRPIVIFEKRRFFRLKERQHRRRRL